MKKKNKLFRHSSTGTSDGSFRKFIQNPQKILKGYVKPGMHVLDLGCGPGLFSFEMAKMVGKKGKVVAADIQQDMLDRLKNKISGLDVGKIIKIHKSGKNRFNLDEKFDFILIFYVVHEVENKKGFFEGLKKLMKSNTKILITEPVFQVSKNSFEEILEIAEEKGFKILNRPKVLLSRSAILSK
jgi:ubiquinone/menaquinone biosynthesis C-methylase UbiE